MIGTGADYDLSFAAATAVSGFHILQEKLAWSNAVGGPGKVCADDFLIQYKLAGVWTTVLHVTEYIEDGYYTFPAITAREWRISSQGSPYVGTPGSWALYLFVPLAYAPGTETYNCDDHLCLQYIVPTDLTTNPSPAKISDQYADWDPDNLIAPVFEPIWNQGPATQEDASDLHSAIVSRYGVDTSAAVFVEDTTRTSFNDYWGFPYDDSDSVNATQAGVRATAILQTRTLAHYTHSPTVICRASQVHLLRAGMAINIKAAAAISGSHLDEYVTRRIAEVRLRPLSPELGIRRSGTPERLYEAALQLDRPAIKAKLGHGKLQSSATTPHSATELPYTPPGGSPISSTDVQGAIDELQGEIDNIPPPLVIEEEDGVPTGSPDTLKVPNGSLTDNGDGSFSLAISGAALTVEEEDGTPTGTPDTLKFPNGSVTDNGDGSFSVAGGSVTYGTPALTLGTTNAAGSTDEAIRRDATILAFDATAPEDQAFDDTAAAGTATVAARRDHLHGMPPGPMINTDSDPGVTIYVGLTDPDGVYSLAEGDIWFDRNP